MPHTITDELLAKYLSGETTPPETEAVEAWATATIENHHYFVEAKQAWSQGFEPSAPSFSTDGHFHKIQDHIYRERQERRRVTKKIMRWAASMSILLISIVSFWFYQNMPVEQLIVETAAGQQKSLILPDGSRVVLNVGSSISFPEAFLQDKREVELVGEAFFDVKRNPEKPFRVKSGQLTTTVLGTSFNIKAYNQWDQAITVATGKVAVGAENQQVHLNPGDQATFHKQTLKTSRVPVEVALAWQNGELHFQDSPLKDVIRSLERWYNMEIILNNPAMELCAFTGQFKDEKLLNVLEVLKEALGISYEVKSNKIFINGEGCKAN